MSEGLDRVRDLKASSSELRRIIAATGSHVGALADA
jgi:hypothetical protein